jgi:hypothetical protein
MENILKLIFGLIAIGVIIWIVVMSLMFFIGSMLALGGGYGSWIALKNYGRALKANVAFEKPIVSTSNEATEESEAGDAEETVRESASDENNFFNETT